MTFKISDTGLVLDTISISTAEKIDAAWVHSGMPNYGMRIYGLRAPGNGTRTFLGIPGDDNAPCYEYLTHNPETGDHSPAYYHRFGPTLADWQAQREATEASREARELYEWASGR